MKSKVYFIKDINSENLIKIYQALNVNLKGNVGVKISTGEANNPNYLDPNLIKDLVKLVNGTLIECNTAYTGKRNILEDHLKIISEHGFDKIANVDIMDSEDSIELPVKVNERLKGINYVGSHLTNYNSILVLSHFKGHPMGGFGGALKNISIGIASRKGKTWIHTSGKTFDHSKIWENLCDHDYFLEAMAEASSAVIDFIKKENMAYVSVLNNLSVDCDCVAHPEPVRMKDIGIMASLDPVALDQACYDAIINSNDPFKDEMIERMDTRHGIHTVERAEELGLGSREYELIEIK